MHNKVPEVVQSEIYATNDLDRDSNEIFPMGMALIKKEQSKNEKLQSMLQGDKYKSELGLLRVPTASLRYTLLSNGKVWVPQSL